MRNVTFAATQFACSWNMLANIAKAKELVREAAAKGAKPFSFRNCSRSLFCQDQSADYFALAAPFEGNPLIAEMAELAKTLNVVLPVSFFERAGHAHFNSLAMIDADGSVMGFFASRTFPTGRAIRKSSTSRQAIRASRSGRRNSGPSDSASAGTSGSLKRARHGIDGRRSSAFIQQPSAPSPAGAAGRQPRSLAARHAGSCRREPMPLIASNRIGRETGKSSEMTFYGSSFIADPTGDIVSELGAEMKV